MENAQTKLCFYRLWDGLHRPMLNSLKAMYECSGRTLSRTVGLGGVPPTPLHTHVAFIGSLHIPIFLVSGWVLLLPVNMRSLATRIDELAEKPPGGYCPDASTLPAPNAKMKMQLGDRRKIKIWAR